MSFESAEMPLENPRESLPQPPEFLVAMSEGFERLETNIESVNQGMDVLLDRVSDISEAERAEMLKPLYRQIEGDTGMHAFSMVLGSAVSAYQGAGNFETLLVALGAGAASLVGGKVLARQFAKLQTLINKDLESFNVGEQR